MNVILKNTGEQISVTQTGHGSYRDNDTGVVYFRTELEFSGLGLLPKYEIKKVNGNDVDPNSEYFVLRLDENGSDPKHTLACKRALVKYAYELYMQDHLPKLVEDIMDKWGWETIARQLIELIHRDNYHENYEENILLFLPQLINAVKMFFKNNMYLMTDETIEMLANKRKNEYDIPENYTNIIGYKEISRILDEYSNS